MPFPILPALVVGLIALAQGSSSAPGPATPGGPGAAGDLLGVEADGRGVLRYRADVAPVVAAQLQAASAIGTGNVRDLVQPYNPAQGVNAAQWAGGEAAQGRVVLLSLVRQPGDPRQICSVAPGQEVSLASGPSARWAVLYDPSQGRGAPGLPEIPGLPQGQQGQIPGAPQGWQLPQWPAGFPQIPGFPGLGQFPGQNQTPPAPGQPALEDVTPTTIEQGLVTVRADVIPAVMAELAGTYVRLGPDGRTWAKADAATGVNAAGLVVQQSAAGLFGLMKLKPWPAGESGGLCFASTADVQSLASPQVPRRWGVLARPAAQAMPLPAPAPAPAPAPQGTVPAVYNPFPPAPGPAPAPGPLPSQGGPLPQMPPVPPGLPQFPPGPIPGYKPGEDPRLPPSGVDLEQEQAYRGVPLPLQQAAEQAAASGDPSRLDALADTTAGQYPQFAAYLRKRAQGMRVTNKGIAAAQGRILVIRPGDLASTWAAWYTGNGLRWPELLSINGLAKKTVGGSTQPDPWSIGQQVEIPVGWNWAKGPPPPPAGTRSAPKAPASPPPPAEEPQAPGNAAVARRFVPDGPTMSKRPASPGTTDARTKR